MGALWAQERRPVSERHFRWKDRAMNLGGPFEFLERPDEDLIRLTMCRYLKFHPEEISSVNSDLQHEQELTEIIQNGLERTKLDKRSNSITFGVLQEETLWSQPSKKCSESEHSEIKSQWDFVKSSRIAKNIKNKPGH